MASFFESRLSLFLFFLFYFFKSPALPYIPCFIGFISSLNCPCSTTGPILFFFWPEIKINIISNKQSCVQVRGDCINAKTNKYNLHNIPELMP
uniref:Secreted protein n=1 Tax=Rhizophora mucronata TaxID=61149 RepID=A0A2P2NJD0_RHIMU